MDTPEGATPPQLPREGGLVEPEPSRRSEALESELAMLESLPLPAVPSVAPTPPAAPRAADEQTVGDDGPGD